MNVVPVFCCKMSKIAVDAGVHPDAEADAPLFSILDLPEEIMVYILSFLTNPGHLLRVAKVCTAWKTLAFTPSLWKSKEYRCIGNFNTKERDIVFRNVPCLAKLQLCSMQEAGSPDMLSALEGRVIPVSVLTVTGRRFESDFYRGIPIHFEGVQNLILYSVKLQMEDYINLGKLRTLTRVEVCGDIVSWVGLQTLLGNCPNVSSLHIGVMSIEANEEMALYETLSSMSDKLTICHFLGCLNLSDKIFRGLGNCYRLEELQINDCHDIRGRGLMCLARLTLLRKLTLTNMLKVPAWCMNEFLNNMQFNNTLRKLHIPVCVNLQDESLKILSERCPNLEAVNLRGCVNVTDDGIAYLLENCTKLERLEMWGISGLTGRTFHDYLPPGLPSLRIIDFRFCSRVPMELLRALETEGRRVLW